LRLWLGLGFLFFYLFNGIYFIVFLKAYKNKKMTSQLLALALFIRKKRLKGFLSFLSVTLQWLLNTMKVKILTSKFLLFFS
jgi:uncharacterized membrane protein